MVNEFGSSHDPFETVGHYREAAHFRSQAARPYRRDVIFYLYCWGGALFLAFIQVVVPIWAALTTGSITFGALIAMLVVMAGTPGVYANVRTAWCDDYVARWAARHGHDKIAWTIQYGTQDPEMPPRLFWAVQNMTNSPWRRRR